MGGGELVLVEARDARRVTMIGTVAFPRELQFTRYTCGPCSVYAIMKYFGVNVTYRNVLEGLKTSRDGTSESAILRYLRARKLRVSVRIPLSWPALLRALAQGAVILVGLDDNAHYGVVHGVDLALGCVYLADPSLRRQLRATTSIERFRTRWTDDGFVVSRRSHSRRH